METNKTFSKILMLLMDPGREDRRMLTLGQVSRAEND